MLRVAINGFGRIGRSLLRAFFENESKHNFNIAAVNEIASIQTMGHLTRYDSTNGKFNGSIEVFKNSLSINGSINSFSVELLKDSTSEDGTKPEFNFVHSSNFGNFGFAVSGSFQDRNNIE